ncbi:uncharacterized protein TrAFT101_003926 [Trichoderma asperellum]|uniref:Uncharacterized protein n=1 Tax=Trichoderma asperellum (strain ATCC 204424 / CBS 433.97 / NBRC 101777) TaxID=1042311 RepID=A0A2T3ZP96_TRIA4|nr:hypothetical protein M441DRAFT_156690 [Trichoderma asperellum CBS 433.97]PTB46625.1 hypothetical protein M441DRAFT_156690 [Trichoderma asperellum CBS 433.97]UKZ88164.1 hypothetical protein TrAFT101_003926 [Trichoderma asperellum]
MTLQSIVTNRYDGQQDARGMAVPYPQPASPTLTNPDMILPDYDEPDTYRGRSQTGPSLWNSGHHIEDGFQFTQDFYANPNPLTTPIIYGNGTMLSDIGEVTEVESVVGPIPSRNASKRSNHSSGDEGPFRASLTAGKRFIQQRHQQQQQQRQQQNDRERRMSTDSTSTIGANDGGAFIDFDDSASVGGDSIFQGDDEESMASEYVEGTAASHHLRAYDPTARRRLSDDGTSISKRAEQILANAKMRLTHMEDNLTRARTLSYSSVSDGSTPSPTMGRAASALRRPDVTSAATNLSKTGNENGAISGSYGTSKVPGYTQRSASALGSAGGYRRPLPTSRSMDGLGSSASTQGAHGHFSYYQSDTTLEALNGNGGQRNGSRTTTSASPTPGAYSELGLTRSASASQMRDLQDQLKGLKGKISTLKEQARADSMKRRSLQSLRMPSPFTNATWEPNSADSRGFYSSGEDTPTTAEHVDGNMSNGENEYARKQPEYIAEPIEEVEEEEEEEEEQEQEQEQLQEQYEEQLQEQYEEQHQEQYEEQYQEQYQEQEEESGEGEGEEQGVRVIDEHPLTPEPQEDHERLEESETPKVRTLASPLEVDQQEAINGRRSSSPAESVATEYTEVESSPEAARDGYASEGEESLYHESFQQPISHEDREDAFDYEHFFLHSAMSTMTDQRLRSESVSSADSVETTRGPIVSHRRSSSADTTASVDTFATATEGLDSRSTTAQGAFRVYTAADLFEDARRRHAHSFRDSSVSSSDETASTLGTHQRSSTMTTPRPMSNSSVRSMHRPSHSSFESIGTNRSFPLINKTKLNSGILTPGGSPDQGLKNKIRDSLLTDTSSIYSQTSSNGRGGQSPALQVLSKDVQVTVEKLVASIGKCVLALGEPDGANPGGHELYKRRIEMALRVLNGEADIP